MLARKETRANISLPTLLRSRYEATVATMISFLSRSHELLLRSRCETLLSNYTHFWFSCVCVFVHLYARCYAAVAFVTKRLMLPLLRSGGGNVRFRAETITETDGPNLREDSVRFRRLLFVASVASGCVVYEPTRRDTTQRDTTR